MVKPKLTRDRNGVKSRKGEIRKNPRTKSTKKEDPKKRQLECVKRKEKRVDENVELSKQGLYKCSKVF